MSYSVLASVYDRFSGGNEEKKAAFLTRIFGRPDGRIILDVGCGSGKLTALMADRGYSMIGCDSSPEMLDLARGAADGKDILFLAQSAERLDLYGTVDGAYAATDVINHITSPSALRRAFEKIALFTVPGGLFVFDVNTEKKFSETLGDNCFVYDDGDFLVWQNRYSEKTRLCRFYLTLFSRQEDGLFEKSREEFSERFYPREEIESALDAAGFTAVSVYGGEYGVRRPPKENDERIIFVAKRRG